MSLKGKTVYLVENNNKDMLLAPYADKNIAFEDKDKAKEYLTENGWVDTFGMGINLAPGVKNIHAQGNVNLSIMATEIR